MVPGQLALVKGWTPEDRPDKPLEPYRPKALEDLLSELNRSSAPEKPAPVQLDAKLSASYVAESVRAWNERQQHCVDWAAYGWPPPAGAQAAAR